MSVRPCRNFISSEGCQIGNLEAMEREKEAILNHIYNSHGWKALIVYYKLREKIFPVNSRRRRAAKFVRNFTWKICGRWRQIGTNAVDAIGSILEGPPLKGKNRMLVIDRFVPTYDKDSGSLRMYSFLKILKELDYRITLLPDDLQKRKPYVDDLQKIGIEVLYGNLDVEKYLGRMGALFTFVILSRPEQVFKYISLIRAYAINSIVIYDTVDLHWLRFERAAAVSGDKELLNKARYFKSMELFNASCSDIVFTITKDEKEFLLKELPNLKIDVIPNIHDVIKEVKPFETRKDIMFIGGFLHHPNEDGVFFFVKEIFPRVKEKIPDIKFFIVGSDPSDAISKLDSKNIKVTGYVRDVTPYFENCRIFVSPLRFGAGMKGKIGQSMAYGLPVVTTTVGAEGIGLVDGENALIADEPGQFSNSIIRLYTEKNLWDKISSKSIEHIRSNYSQEVIAPKIAELFNSINFQGR
ncbi:MAG: glycosyltransferase family 4 protein [Deltaproteobacteria bacterium]|nr:glycosyltransferase family 4 protein [Deltaproteobacteria bacterium]